MTTLHSAIGSLLDHTHATGYHTHRGLTLVPLFAPTRDHPSYLSLSEALEQEGFLVTEVSKGGSVPDLLVTNKTPYNVFLFDGQELKGAKQNRVLNTSILVPAESELTIPVSCTEQGRWAYASAAFSDSEAIMAHKLRRSKSASVSAAYDAVAKPLSDQAAVWGEIEALHFCAGTSGSSATRAMKDAYAAHQRDLDAFKDAFPCEANQSGLLAIRNGSVEGADLLSRPDVYKDLHDSLVQSYAMEALVRKEEKKDKPAGSDPAALAQEFLEGARECQDSTHDSPGLGTDHRLTGDHLRGSALVVDDTTIHLALFSTDGENASPEIPIASSHRRRLWHMRGREEDL